MALAEFLLFGCFSELLNTAGGKQSLPGQDATPFSLPFLHFLVRVS